MSTPVKILGRQSPSIARGTGRKSPSIARGTGRKSPTVCRGTSSQSPSGSCSSVGTGRQSPSGRESPSGRNSPNKFIFTLPPQLTQPQYQPDTQLLQAPHVIQEQHLQNKTKNININPVLTKKELESESTNITPVSSLVSSLVSSPDSILPENTKYIYKHIYLAQLKIINILKCLVFQNMSLICGYFNSEQLMINEYTKYFMCQIKHYQTLNNEIFTSEQIEDLFLNESIYPETKNRLNVQSAMDILISYPNFIHFINNLKTYFQSNYKLEYSTKGNYQFSNIVKIFDCINNINFEVQFIVLFNETENGIAKIVPLQIPYGFYNLENLYLTNDGCDKFAIQYSSSSLTYIINNLTMKNISIMPMLNDSDYTQLAKYVLYLLQINDHNNYNNYNKYNEYNEYMYEFDIFNTIHSKSDFWLTNKNTSYTSCKCCKCNTNINKNTKYVISKCCNKEYHIECMEMNYSRKGFYTYLMCECGSDSIDENNSNSKLLIALYKNM